MEPVQQTRLDPFQARRQPGALGAARHHTDGHNRPGNKTQAAQQGKERYGQRFAGNPAPENRAPEEQDPQTKHRPQHGAVPDESEPFPAELRAIQARFDH